MTEEYMTTQEIAKIMGCTQAYVAMLAKRGKFPGARKLDPTRRNSALRIPREDVDQFMQSQIVSPEIQQKEQSEI